MKKLTRHLLSMTAAMAIGSSAVLSCGLPSALAAEAQEAEEAGKLVPVIIRLSGEAVLAGEGAAQLGTDYLDTPEATAKAEALRQTSSEAEAAIRSLYPELEVGYRFDLLMNGFSCELPKGLLDEARACPWVEDIEEIETVNIQRPDLYTAPELGEVSYFRETTGYFGEGEVIAVLDGEFDIDHDMFAPIDDKNNKLTKEDIIAAAGNLNVQVDPEQAYISSKLPYVIDYADDTPYESSDPKEFHGTHVSGIAAGNKISDADGNELSGIARDAQIIMMRVFGDVLVDEVQGTYQNAVKYDAALAALEDAATLRADVINMSFGSPEPDLDSISYKDTLKSLNNAGITIVAAAGNSSNNRIIEGTYLDMDAAVPDTQTVSEPSSFKEVLSVASANNSMRRDPCFKIEGLDDEIPFSVADDRILSEILDDGVYEYVYCGLGTPGDFEGKDLTGKIALVDRGGFTFSEKAYNAEQAGAVAMIVCDNIDEQSLIGMALDGVTLPSVFISLNNGIKMKEAESGKIRLDSTITVITPLDGGISGFSSFGPAEDLTLKPDIAGIGGSVTSAAKNNSLMQIEGTSMSSPYVAGCAAILDQYLRKNGMVLSGSAKTAFIKNLLMNSAVLFQNGDTYESPRRQGAGLVNLKNVLNDRVILTGEGGLAKVELKDKLTDKISFNVDIRNFSDQDVEFKEARLVLTAEDGAMIENDESGQISIIGSSNIGVTADLSSLLSTAAGETRTVTVSAQLSEADLAARSTSFPNGFFVEGYIILSGAENCCDVSIPVMGFCGDWTQAPIFHSGTKYLAPYQLFTTAGNGSFDASYSFAGVAEATARLIERLPEEDAEYVLANPFSIADYYDDEYFGDLMNCYSESTYLSPDGDGLSDRFGIVFSLLRSAHISGLRIYDSENNLVSESDAANVPAQKVVYSMSEEDLRSLPDGEYRGSFEGYIYYEGAENNPQAYDFPIVVDKKAPSLEVKPKEENGRKLIEITSADENLDGIFITGRGDGGIAGEYTADGACFPLCNMR